jgi:hypothetical protein
MTAPFRVNPELTLGNLLTVAAMILGLTGSWFVMRLNVDQNTARIQALEVSVRAELDAVRLEVRAVSDRGQSDREAALAQQIELTRVLTEMQTDIRYLREALDASRKAGAK